MIFLYYFVGHFARPEEIVQLRNFSELPSRRCNFSQGKLPMKEVNVESVLDLMKNRLVTPPRKKL